MGITGGKNQNFYFFNQIFECTLWCGCKSCFFPQPITQLNSLFPAEDRGNDDYGGEDLPTEEDFMMWFFNQMSGGDECISREDLLNSMGAIEVCLEAMKQNNP